MEKVQNVDEYIKQLSPSQAEAITKLRKLVKETAPEAEESIAYRMPAYKLKGRPLVYSAAFPNHIGFYPTPSGVSQFAEELAKYKQGKGSIQFPINEPMPLELVRKIVKLRVAETNENH